MLRARDGPGRRPVDRPGNQGAATGLGSRRDAPERRGLARTPGHAGRRQPPAHPVGRRRARPATMREPRRVSLAPARIVCGLASHPRSRLRQPRQPRARRAPAHRWPCLVRRGRTRNMSPAPCTSPRGSAGLDDCDVRSPRKALPRALNRPAWGACLPALLEHSATVVRPTCSGLGKFPLCDPAARLRRPGGPWPASVSRGPPEIPEST